MLTDVTDSHCRQMLLCTGLFWLQAGQTNTVAGANNLRGLLFFELMFMSMRAMLGALFTFPSEFKMMLKVSLNVHHAQKHRHDLIGTDLDGDSSPCCSLTVLL